MTPQTTAIPDEIVALQAQVQLNATIQTSVFSLITGLVLLIQQAATDSTGVQSQALATTLAQNAPTLAQACVKPN
jgi:hypothetical protein